MFIGSDVHLLEPADFFKSLHILDDSRDLSDEG